LQVESARFSLDAKCNQIVNFASWFSVIKASPFQLRCEV